MMDVMNVGSPFVDTLRFQYDSFNQKVSGFIFYENQKVYYFMVSEKRKK